MQACSHFEWKVTAQKYLAFACLLPNWSDAILLIDILVHKIFIVIIVFIIISVVFIMIILLKFVYMLMSCPKTMASGVLRSISRAVEKEHVIMYE